MKLKILVFLLCVYHSYNLRAQNVDSLLVVAQATKDDSISLIKMNIAGYLCIFKDRVKARKILLNATRKATRTNRLYNQTELSNTLGVYHDVTGNKDSAALYFDAALQLSQKGKYTDLEVRCINNLGMFNWNRGRLNEALKFFLEALELNDKVPNGPTKTPNSSMYNNIGLIYQELDLHKKALDYHKKAYDIRLSKNKKQELPISLNNLGICYERLGEREKAKKAYNEGLRLAEEYNPAEYYKLLENYATILMAEEKYSEAVEILLKSLNRPPEIPINPKSKLHLCGSLATAYINLNLPEMAVSFGEEGLAILRQQPGLVIYSEDIYISLARAYYMKGDLEKGHRYSLEFSRNVKERFSKENAANIADMEIKYETERKEKIIAEGRIKLLKADAAAHLQQVEISRNEALLLKSRAESEKNGKLIALNHARLLKSEAESGKQEKLIATNKALLLETEAEVREKNFMFMIALSFIGFLSIIGYLLYRQQNLENRQIKKEFELKSALSQIETQNKLQEQRLSISRDLHDNIGAQLTFIISTLDSLRFRLQGNVPAVTTKLEGISSFTRQTIIELRDTIWAMNTDHITLDDLRIRILNFVEKAQEANEGINFTFFIESTLVDLELSSVAGMNIYRTIQEAVNNVIKHAHANKIEITIFEEDNSIQIIIMDNGAGFDLKNTLRGNGILNMEKRILDIGGAFNIESILNNGTIIKIKLQKLMQTA